MTDMARTTGTGILLILACSLAGFCGSPGYGAHDVLRSLRLPGDFAREAFPRAYTVPVTLSGTIADEMAAPFKTLKLSAPRYRETRDRDGGFSLAIINEDYAADTRALLSGILNPVEMIDMTVRSVLKFTEKEAFETLVRETAISTGTIRSNGTDLTHIRLKPRGERFSYAYEDLGTFMEESWLTGLTILVDPRQNTVCELTMHKVGRSYTIDRQEAPRAESLAVSYRFSYTTAGGRLLPERLELSINGETTLVITANYRTEKDYMLFDTRSICYHRRDAGASCLVMTYGAYDLTGRPAPAVRRSPGAVNRDLDQAARLSRKALEQLREGRIGSAGRLLAKLVESYPGTPQASEARRLLEGLPGGR